MLVKGTYMDFYLTVPLTQLFLLLRSNVLVSEEYDATFCNQQGEFVFLFCGEVFQLQTLDLSANVGG
jgi:hypothetical protein